MSKEAHSAIPSWSGYIYQGKLAIYEALRVIKKQLNGDINFDFSAYSLEVEWQEDFSIKIGEDYKSIHQVKAYADGASPTQYNKALQDLFKKIDSKVCDIGFLNLWKNIDFTTGTESKNFSELKTANKGKYSQDILDKVKVYEYHTGNKTCDLDESNELILLMIESIYGLNNFEQEALTSNQFEYVLFSLYKLLDTHILEVHKGERGKEDTMPFSEILDIFMLNYEEYSDEYKYIKVKNNLLYQISRYCDNPDLCSYAGWSSEEDCIDCVLFDIEKTLENMSAKEIYILVYSATPDYRVFEDLIRENGLKYGLIRILHNINPACRTSDFHFKTSKYCVPSSITEYRNKNEIAKKILENKSLDLLVNQFEIDMYISDDVEVLNLEEEARKIKSVDDETLAGIYESREEKTICKIKNLQIKPLDNIKGEINNAY